jgi:hypothetical protein
VGPFDDHRPEYPVGAVALDAADANLLGPAEREVETLRLLPDVLGRQTGLLEQRNDRRDRRLGGAGEGD